MSIQYVDRFGDAVGHVAGTYNITASNNQFSISVDGGANQVVSLTTGATQTVANIVTDLAGLTDCAASEVNVNGARYLRIRTTSNSGAASTILFNAPANNSNALLGFVATTYTGGTNVSTTFVTSTKQNIIDGIQVALVSAGWIVISGSLSTPCVMQSAMSPSGQNLRMRIRMTTAGSNCTIISGENSQSTRSGGNSNSSNGMFLLPGTAKTWRIIANKYQAFVFVPGSNTAREYAGWGVPYLPTFMQGVLYDSFWMNCNAANDSDGSTRGSFRGSLGGWNNSTGGNAQFLTNNTLWEIANNPNAGGNGTFSLISPLGAIAVSTTSWYRWHDLSAFMSEPIMAWGAAGPNDEAMARGQLWDAFVSSEAYAIDSTLTAIDSHNWWNLTNNNTGTGYATRGSVFVATT